MKYCLMFPPDGQMTRSFAYIRHEDICTINPEDGDRYLTPSEVAAYLLGAPASSFPVEAPKDEEGGV